MTNETLLNAVRQYETLLLSMQVKPVQSDDKPLERALWCCQQIPQFVKDNRIPKAMRWLGFIQGVLFATDIFSVNDLKGHVKPE